MWESISNFALVTRELGDRCQMLGNGGYTPNSKLFLRYNTVVNPFPVIERTTDQEGKKRHLSTKKFHLRCKVSRFPALYKHNVKQKHQ